VGSIPAGPANISSGESPNNRERLFAIKIEGKVKPILHNIYPSKHRSVGYLRVVYKQAFLLIFFLLLIVFGVLEGQYGIVSYFVKVVCSSCIGLG
jgi:hypothetical protein